MRNLQRLQIPCGLGTLNRSKSPIEVQNEDLIATEALTYEDDTWRKEGGAAKFNSTAITGEPAVLGLHDYVGDDADATQELVAMLSDGKLVTLNVGGIDKTLAVGLTVDQPVVMTEGSHDGTKFLAVCTGSDQMWIYEGGEVATVLAAENRVADWATDPPDWAFQHNGRMWAGGKPHLVYGSALLNQKDFAEDTEGSHVFSVYPGEGERIVGGVSWRGRAFFFKYPRGIYFLDDSHADSSNWQIKRFALYVGAAGQNALVEAMDDIFWPSPDGFIHVLSAVEEFGDAESSAVLPSAMGPVLRDNVNFDRLAHAQGVFYAPKRKVFWGLTKGASATHNNFVVGLDLHRGQGAQGYSSERDEATAATVRRDPTTKQEVPLLGDSAGFVWELDRARRAKDGAGYQARFETKDIEFAPGAIQSVNLVELEAEIPVADATLFEVDVYRDGNYSEALTFQSAIGGGVLGSFTLGVDTLGAEALTNSRRRIRGVCHRIKLIGKHSGAGDSFSVASFTVRYRPGQG